MKLSDELKKEINEIARNKGLNVAEDASVLLVEAAFALLATLVPKVSFGLGGIIIPIIAIVKPKILEMLDEIDGEDDEGR
jgi:hypothetical protein